MVVGVSVGPGGGLVAVGVGVGVGGGTVRVGVGVTVGWGVPARMDGTNQKASALVGLALAFTPRTNRTVWPSRNEISSLMRVMSPS